jgi:energy-coupling factor transporter ATP-binding protein EcfA2
VQRPIPPNPYQGLFAFRETDSHFFFGREEVVKVLKERVEKTSLQAIVGASGSGKSSVVFAGLVPEFRKQDWLIQDFRPGRNPYRNLARALLKLQGKENPTTKEISDLGNSLEKGETKLLDALDDTLEQNPNATLLLIADQFEELFTISEANLSDAVIHTEASQDKESSEETAKAFDPKPFIDQLLASTRQDGSRFHLLLTLRADFMGRASSHRAFADALNHESTLYTLGPMNSQELQAAIEKPAEKQGVSLEEGLSERILQEVARQEGSLPLLEFALSELWQKQDNGILTHHAYDSIGGVEGALARHADATYNSLKPAERTLAQRVFLQLVYPGAGQEDTRRVASYQELKDVWQVVNTLANKRLLVTDESEGQQTAEVIHEALIRRWGKLREWMNDHRAFRTWQERLRQDVKLWQGKDKAHDTLLSGYRLDEALKMQKDYDSLLSDYERSFIVEGLKQREHEKANREAQRQREIEALKKINEEQKLRTEAERSGRRNTRRWLNIALIFLGIALIAVLVALDQRGRARQEAERATHEAARAEHTAQIARAGELVAQGQVEHEENPLLGLQLALEGLQTVPEDEQEKLRDLTSTATTLALQGRLLKLGNDVVNIYTPATEKLDWFIATYNGKASDLRTFRDGELVTTLTGEVSYVTFSPDGQWFVVNYRDAPDELRETAEPETVVTTLTGDVAFFAVRFSPDSRWFVVVYTDAPNELRRTHQPDVITKLGLGLEDFVFDDSTQRLVLVYSDGRSYLLDLAWLEAMGGRDDLSREELIQLACDGPLKLGIVTAKDLQPFLGENESKVCK